MNDDIAARNRANAQKSTGPRTKEGKAIVARNARRHGATGRPDSASVALWLAVILDLSEIRPADLMPDNEVGYRALALAEAEARLVATELALQVFEAGAKEARDRYQRDLIGYRQFVEVEISALMMPPGTSVQEDSWQAFRQQFPETQLGSNRHRLLRRYFAEARAQRRHAFERWIKARQ